MTHLEIQELVQTIEKNLDLVNIRMISLEEQIQSIKELLHKLIEGKHV